MRKLFALLTIALMFSASASFACTNFIVTKGASNDGSAFLSYAADSHVLYGELYYRPAADYQPGTMMKIYNWDTGQYLGDIPQVLHTYNVVGNVNEHQLAIGETTYGGREELWEGDGIIDYGSLIYLALQRAKNAREAIKVMTELMSKYGYVSEGESFSIVDKDEAWILEVIGKGKGQKGAVWIARMIPDGYVSAHANQARITTFPQATKKSKDVVTFKNIDKLLTDKNITCVYSDDVITFAREKGYFKGNDADFSFSDTYMPAIVIKLDTLPFLSSFEGFYAIARHHDLYMVIDVGKSIIPKEERLRVVNVDIIESWAITKSIGVDLFHSYRQVYDFQKRALCKRVVSDVHDIAAQGDAGKVDTTIESFAADVANPIRNIVDGFRFWNDYITRIGVLVVIINNNQVSFSAPTPWDLLRGFTVIDTIDIIIVGECILANHHECQSQN